MASARHSWQGVRDLFALDLRSLAVFRVALAILVFSDLARRWVDRAAHYGEAGVLPVAEWLSLRGADIGWLAGWVPASEPQLGALFGACALSAVLLAIGWQTRAATLATWFLVFAIQARNPMVLNGGDPLLRLLLFWGLFLPLGGRASIDSLRSGGSADRVSSFGSAGLMVQVCIVYWATAVLKNHPIWNEEGSALFYALQIDGFATPLGQTLLGFPRFLRPLTLAVWWTELLAPFLVFLPFWRGAVRTTTVFAFVAMHLAFGLFLEIGMFPLVSAASWLALLPSEFWERLGSLSRRRPHFPNPRVTPMGHVNASLSLGFVVAWNVATVSEIDWDRPRARVFEAAALVSGLHQHWNMFAPYPLVDDGWYVIEGSLESGRRVDLWRDGRAVVWTKPTHVSGEYSNQRWRKYMMNLTRERNAQHRGLYADYLCRSWNAGHAGRESLDALRMVFVRERTRPGYRVAAPRPDLLLDHRCSRPGSQQVANLGRFRARASPAVHVTRK